MAMEDATRVDNARPSLEQLGKKNSPSELAAPLCMTILEKAASFIRKGEGAGSVLGGEGGVWGQFSVFCHYFTNLQERERE